MEHRRYESYKDSGVEWLGEVPEGWGVTRLKNLLVEVDERNGADERELLGLSKSRGVMKRSEIDQGAQEATTLEKYKKVEPGDLVMNKMQAWNGVFGLTKWQGVVSPDYAVFRFRDPRQSAYYTRIFRTDAAAGEFFRWSRGMGTAFLRLNTSDFFNVRVPLPPLGEQRAIAGFLDAETGKIDALVAEQRRLVGLLQEKRAAVIHHAVTRGLDPHAPTRPSGVEWLGDVPEHWEVVRLKYFTRSISQGWSPQCENFPVDAPDGWGVLKVGCVNGPTFDSTENKQLPADLEPVADLVVEPGDLLISRANTRALVGSAAVVTPHEGRLMLCDKLYRLQLKERVSSGFVCRFLHSDAARADIELAASGASQSMVNIGQSVILDLVLGLPPRAEQDAIVEHLQASAATFDRLLGEAEAAIALLLERRSALISAAVTGRIRVPGV